MAMFFFTTVNYLKYIILARHRIGHGIHSPFVFDIVNRVFRNKTDSKIVCIIENVRKSMMLDPRKITFEDFGIGSDKHKTKKRKVAEVAKRSPVPLKFGNLLSNMASEFGGNGIIEFGTSLGISAMYLASSSASTRVFTMEGSAEIAEIAKENFKTAGISNCQVFIGEFDIVLPDVLKKCTPPGLVFIDGNHRKEPVLRYFYKIAEVANKKTVIIIDDINYSREMAEAWKVIKNEKQVTVTIDLNRMGIVFFREGITPQNYVIRY